MIFLREALTNLRTVGTIAPCSRAAARKLTKPIDFDRARLIVELGGGTGAITKEILRRMRKDAVLLVFEVNETFCAKLRQLDDPRLRVIHDSAERLRAYLEGYGRDTADCIISTLPLVAFPDSLKESILSVVRETLAPDAVYTQIQYSLLTHRDIKKYFPRMRLDFTPWNLPPAFFYICER